MLVVKLCNRLIVLPHSHIIIVKPCNCATVKLYIRINDYTNSQISKLANSSINYHYAIFEGLAARKLIKATTKLPDVYQGKEVHTWAFLNNEKKTQASTSVYLGKITLT
ncbi:hypothetical protein BAS06_07990 [Elizabethkingia miricola]|nr:hypothetical protein BAS06_07990 [Elizabethkingia miricola]